MSRSVVAHVVAVLITGITIAVALPLVLGPATASSPRPPSPWSEVRSLDGGGNNRRHPSWGQAGTNYLRLSAARYADQAGTRSTAHQPATSATGSSTTGARTCSRRTG